MAPQLADQRLAEQFAGGRVGFAYQALAIDHDHPTGQQVQQVLQAVGQAFLFAQFIDALGADHRQLALEFADPGFEQAVGLAQLAGHLIEQGEGLLDTLAAVLLDRGLPLRIGG
ncbi:hypothetical protein D3C74_441820 [compost metagenome]